MVDVENASIWIESVDGNGRTYDDGELQLLLHSNICTPGWLCLASRASSLFWAAGPCNRNKRSGRRQQVPRTNLTANLWWLVAFTAAAAMTAHSRIPRTLLAYCPRVMVVCLLPVSSLVHSCVHQLQICRRTRRSTGEGFMYEARLDVCTSESCLFTAIFRTQCCGSRVHAHGFGAAAWVTTPPALNLDYFRPRMVWPAVTA